MPGICRLALLLALAGAAFGQGHHHGAASGGDGRYNPFVTADGGGGFYLAYVEESAGARNVMLRRSGDGRTFSQSVRVNHLAGDATVRNENPPKLAVGPAGELYVAWANETGRWKGNVRFSRSLDGGRTFAPALTLNSDAAGEPRGHAFQSMAVDGAGRVYVAWIDERAKQPGDRGAEVWLAVSADRGRSFAPDRRVLQDVCECCRTTLAVDRRGALYLSYRTVPRSGAMLRDVVVARSEDGGRTFAPRPVSRDGWEVGGCPVAGPALGIDPQGRLAVTWFLGGGERPGLYWAASEDGGASFTPRRLLDPEQHLGKHAQMARLDSGALVVAWDDTAGGGRTTWGVLDPVSGRIEARAAHPGLAYPVVAASGDRALLAAMHAATRAIHLETRGPDGVGAVELR